MTKKRTVEKHGRLVSVGAHESRGIPDARYLAIADRVLNQTENEVQDVEVESTRKAQREARCLLHYRQP